MSLLFHLGVASFSKLIYLSSITNTDASYTKLYKLYSPDSYTRNIQVYVGKCDNIFSFDHAELEVIELSKVILAAAELSMLTTFIRQCHLLSIFSH